MKKIVIRTHGGKGIGLGHLMRCLSIAIGLKRYATYDSFEIEWVVNEEALPFIEKKGFRGSVSERFSTDERHLFHEKEPDCILLDAYTAGNEYLSFLKSLAETVILIDDNNDRYVSDAVDLVINGNIHAETLLYKNTLPNTKGLLGPLFLAMKEEYWDSQESVPQEPARILVTVGGSDPFCVMETIASALGEYPGYKTLIIGPSFDPSEIRRMKASFTKGYTLVFSPNSLKPYMQQAGIVLTAAGSTVYEALKLERIPIVFEMAENQKPIARVLSEEGVINLGWYQGLSSEKILKAALLALDENRYRYQRYSGLFSLFDGQGVCRIVHALEAFLGGKNE